MMNKNIYFELVDCKHLNIIFNTQKNALKNNYKTLKKHIASFIITKINA